jgi:tetratricopeptide (TPR) repeat protein
MPKHANKDSTAAHRRSTPGQRAGAEPRHTGSKPPEGNRWKERPLPVAIVLFCLVVFAFLPVLKNQFVNYDDDVYITANSHVLGGLTWKNLEWASLSIEAGGYWNPLTWVSHMLDCQMFGLAPWGHHLTNVLLHALNTVLVFLLLRKMTGAVWRSLLVAAFFGLHPLRVESVAWAAERKDVLSTTFWALTLLAYARYAKEGGVVRGKSGFFYTYWLALLCFVLGLMSKPMLVTVPFLLLLLDYWPLDRFSHRGLPGLLTEKAPFFVLAAIAGAVTFAAQKCSGAVLVNVPAGSRLANVPVAYCRYLGNLFWPADLSVFYPYQLHWPMGVVVCSTLLVAGISAFVIALRRYAWLPAGWFWFLGTLMPVIGFVQSGSQSIADRYTYVASLGIFILVVWGVAELTRRFHIPTAVPTAAALAGLLCCVLVLHGQIGYWRNSETLFRHALAVTTNNVVAHNNLGEYLVSQGRFNEAIPELQEAIRLKPEDPEALNDLGLVSAREGHLDEAISFYRKALNVKPDSVEALNNLGAALSDQGRFDDAIHEFNEALRLDPDTASAHHNLGLALAKKGRLDEAIACFRDALRLDPAYFEAHCNLGFALSQKGEPDEAISEFREALKLRPDDAKAHNNLGETLARKGALQEAIKEFQEALRSQPDYPEAQRNLRDTLARVANGSAQ